MPTSVIGSPCRSIDHGNPLHHAIRWVECSFVSGPVPRDNALQETPLFPAEAKGGGSGSRRIKRSPRTRPDPSQKADHYGFHALWEKCPQRPRGLGNRVWSPVGRRRRNPSSRPLDEPKAVSRLSAKSLRRRDAPWDRHHPRNPAIDALPLTLCLVQQGRSSRPSTSCLVSLHPYRAAGFLFAPQSLWQQPCPRCGGEDSQPW
jgi:hypothetical protein